MITQQTAASAAKNRFRLLTDEEIEQQPDQEWMIDKVLSLGSLWLFFGQYGVGKSFVLLDLLIRVSLGWKWNGRDVRQMPVIYVCAEGLTGVKKRIRAWKQHHGIASLPGFRCMPEAVQLHDEDDIKELVARIRELMPAGQPVLIAFDTLSRCFVGGDENQSRDIGLLIAGADKLRAHGATVGIAHHPVRSKSRNRKPNERGSSALSGAMDTMIRVERDGKDGSITLSCEKQKDEEDFEAIKVGLEIVTLPDGKTTSCVVVSECSEGKVQVGPSTRLKGTLDALRQFGARAVDDRTWKEAATKGDRISERKFYDDKKALLNEGLVEETQQGFRVIGANSSLHLMQEPEVQKVVQMHHRGATAADALTVSPAAT